MNGERIFWLAIRNMSAEELLSVGDRLSSCFLTENNGSKIFSSGPGLSEYLFTLAEARLDELDQD